MTRGAQPEDCLAAQTVALQNGGNVRAVNLSFGESLRQDPRTNAQLDGNALLTCLDSKQIGGAALDVLEGEELILDEKQLMYYKHENEKLEELAKNHILLKRDNVVSSTALGLADLGVTPTSVEAVIPSYLWRYRAKGEYAQSQARPAQQDY